MPAENPAVDAPHVNLHAWDAGGAASAAALAAWVGARLEAHEASLAALLAVDYSRLARWSGVAYGLTIVLLVAVFVFGSRVHGGKRWITLGIFGLQPSEFAKIAFILLLANFLSRPAD